MCDDANGVVFTFTTVPILAQNQLSGLNGMLDALHSLIYLFCVGVVSLACGRDTNQKKGTRIART